MRLESCRCRPLTCVSAKKPALVVFALALAVASLSPAPIALAQGAFSPVPKGPAPTPAPAPIAPAPHAVTPNIPIAPPAVAPTFPNPLANQPASSEQNDTKRSSNGSDAVSSPPTTAGTPAPQATAGTPISGVPVGLDHEPGGNLVAVNKTDDKGGFSFGKLAPGQYTLKLSGKDLPGPTTGAQPQALLIGLLLPAVQKAREASFVEHSFTRGSADQDLKIAFRIGRDGRIMSIDWGDGNGPIDPAKEARTLPLPQDAQPGEIRGTMTASSGPRIPAPQATAGTPISSVPVGLDHDPGGNLVAVNKTDDKGGFSFGKLAPGQYTLKFSSKDFAPAPITGAKPQEELILIGLLLPAVAKAPDARLAEHAFTRSGADQGIKIAFRIGRDGRIMAIDWGDGAGPVDPAKEARFLPLPRGAQPGELSGMIFDRWGNL